MKVLFKKNILEKINYICYIKKLLSSIKYIYRWVIIKVINKKGDYKKRWGEKY